MSDDELRQKLEATGHYLSIEDWLQSLTFLGTWSGLSRSWRTNEIMMLEVTQNYPFPICDTIEDNHVPMP